MGITTQTRGDVKQGGTSSTSTDLRIAFNNGGGTADLQVDRWGGHRAAQRAGSARG